MSQDIFEEIDPSISGTELATILNDFKDAVVSGVSGTSRPAELQAGGTWVDITNDPTYWSFKMYTGVTDVEIFRLYLDTSVASISNANSDFSIQRVSSDTTGAILKLIKQRIATNGQVLSGDVVGELRFVGRGNDSSNPVVAKVIWTATDDQTASNFGGTLSFQSTPDGSATLTEHMRFINGLVETVLPLKLNSLRLVGQNVATTATIAQLSAAKGLVEFTGSTATDVQGINSAHDSQVVTLHNRSTANVTLKHQNGSASANDRMKLPGASDYIMIPEASVTLYYCTTDSLWKLQSTADRSFNGYTLQTFYGPVNTWTAVGTIARIRAYRKVQGMYNEHKGFVDIFGAAYAWGVNTNGELGLGDVTARSSPVAVLGSKIFTKIYGTAIGAGGGGTCNFGIDNTGAAYSWGFNANGQLGLGDVTPRSSPVAVLGSQKWFKIFSRESNIYGLNTGYVAYAWGLNTNGELGVGDVTPRSSPVAVLGSRTFVKIIPARKSSGSETSVVAIQKDGALYAWGANGKGQLGVGDVTPRSSPVAVLGSITFSDVVGVNGSTTTSFVGLNTAGAAYAWGDNGLGQLGVGDTTGRSSPVAVVGGITFKQIIAHPLSNSFFGLTSAGVLYAWGSNGSGVLGVGDVTARSSPVAVLGGFTFAKVIANRDQIFALTADGVAYSWGSNLGGVLGLGDVVSRSSPVAVLGGFSFAEIICPDVSTVIGVLGDGTMYAWGLNTSGGIGDGTVAAKSSPVAVLGSLRSDITQPSYSADLTLTSGQAYTIVISDGGIATFNGLPLGLNIGKVEVEYLQ